MRRHPLTVEGQCSNPSCLKGYVCEAHEQDAFECPACGGVQSDWEPVSPHTVRACAHMLTRRGGPNDAELLETWSPRAVYDAIQTMTEDDVDKLAEFVAEALEHLRFDMTEGRRGAVRHTTGNLAMRILAHVKMGQDSELCNAALAYEPAILAQAMGKLDRDHRTDALGKLKELAAEDEGLRKRLFDAGLIDCVATRELVAEGVG